MNPESVSLRPVRVARRAVYDVFRGAGRSMKLYLRLKFRMCPILRIEAYVPDGGDVLDLGCGNGLFAAILKLGSPDRRIIGIDLDARKITAARRSLGTLRGVDFRLGDIVSASYPKTGACTIIDVLYLLPVETQNAILKKCAEALPAGGALILKEMDLAPRWKYAWNAVQETISVKIVGFTLGSRFHFRSRRLCASVGIRRGDRHPPPGLSLLPYPLRRPEKIGIRRGGFRRGGDPWTGRPPGPADLRQIRRYGITYG